MRDSGGDDQLRPDAETEEPPADWNESRVGRTRNAVSALLDLAPPTARMIRPDGSEAEVPAAEVAVADRFIVRAGDRVQLDGKVVEGRGAVNQAPITGDSTLAAKEPGDEVYAGTINGEDTLTVRASKAADDTVLARIIRMVGEAHARRAPVEQWVERFARVCTPGSCQALGYREAPCPASSRAILGMCR